MFKIVFSPERELWPAQNAKNKFEKGFRFLIATCDYCIVFWTSNFEFFAVVQSNNDSIKKIIMKISTK
jgi:hypothetical protein